MTLDTTHKCPQCSESFHRESGLVSHLQRVHDWPSPAAAEGGGQPTFFERLIHGPEEAPPPGNFAAADPEDASSVADHEGIRLALWRAYLRWRHPELELTPEDLRILDNLSALAATYRGPDAKMD